MVAQLSHLIYRTEQVRSGEQAAAVAIGLSMAQLMQAAAQACLQAIQDHCAAPARVAIVCGPGNNGGDGWVLARLAQAAGYQVTVYAVPPTTKLAQQAQAAWQAEGGRWQSSIDSLHGYQILVDAVLGSGLTRPLAGFYLAAVQAINAAANTAWVLSVDVPTGLNSDTGQPQPIAVTAAHTVTMVAIKAGLVTGKAKDYVGQLSLAELGIGAAFSQQPPMAELVQPELARRWLAKRKSSSHKGDHGHLVLIAGGPGMSGAAILAGRAALRSGAGKVTLVTHPHTLAIIAQAQPELMVHGTDEKGLIPWLEQANAIVIGPGLGRDAWAQQQLQQLLDWHTELSGPLPPVVADADALNLLAQLQQGETPPHLRQWVLTPHPAEAGRLLRSVMSTRFADENMTAVVEADRYEALTQLVTNFNAQVLLKGAGTLIAGPAHQIERILVCERGSPALATAGSGDVLSGLLGALLAQHRLPSAAALHELAATAVWVHAVAGENAAQAGERGTIASDIVNELRALVNP